MIVVNRFVTDIFEYDVIVYGPHTSHTFHNVGNGRFYRYFYRMFGDCVTEFRTINDTSFLPVLTLDTAVSDDTTVVDIKDSLGSYVTTKTTDKPMGGYLFKPNPVDRDLDIQILKEGFHTISSTTDPLYVVVLEGPISVKPATRVESSQWFKVVPGKTVEILLEQHQKVAVVKEK